MRKKKRGTALLIALTLVALSGLAAVPETPLAATLLYKSYLVRKDGGQDILCDPYIVQPNDYVLKLFRERGQISQSDFPEFLSIFKRINPQIGNINQIQPGQNIFIPLKKLAPNSLPNQETGVVSIPYVTLSSLPALLGKNADNYVLRRGDTVSGIVEAVFGKYGSSGYQKGLRIFRLLNPDISNPNRIYAGQTVWLPTAALRNQPWYASLFDASGNIITTRPPTASGPSPPPPPEKHHGPLQTVASLLGARLQDRGTYYFPRPGRTDAKLDLAKYPILETPDHQRTLILPSTLGSQEMSDLDLPTIQSFWPSLSVLTVAADAPVGHILDAYVSTMPGGSSGPDTVRFIDRGVKVSVSARWWLDTPVTEADGGLPKARTGILPYGGPDAAIPGSLMAYLARHGILLKAVDGSTPEKEDPPASASLKQIPSTQPKAFVAGLTAALGLSYSTGVSISFPYCGLQIPAVTNLITTREGRSVLVDFGSFYGDAIASIERSGLQVLSIRAGEPRRRITEQILTTVGFHYKKNPTFTVPSIHAAYGVKFSVPGFLVTKGASKEQLLSLAPLDPALVQWFTYKGFDILYIVTQEAKS